jgi:serine/threonine-protein kinase
LASIIDDGTTGWEEEEKALDRILAMDPQDGEAYLLRSECEAYQGRFQEALATAEACLHAVPAADRCLMWRLTVEEQVGPADTLEADARRLLAISPKLGHRWLAAALLAEGRPSAVVREALEMDGHKDPTYPGIDDVRYALDVLAGDFASAERRAVSLMTRVDTDADRGAHASAVKRLIELYREEGDMARAVALARSYLDRKDAWQADPRGEDFAISRDPTPYMWSVLVHGDAAPASQLDSVRDAWLALWQRGARPAYAPFLWPHAYAVTVESAPEAEVAVGEMAKFGPIPHYWPLTFLGGDVGRTLYLAGRSDEALEWLKMSVHSALALEFPIEHTRASWWLGQALERQGDRAGACEAYTNVLHVWGEAKPTSVTAKRARGRAAALRCTGITVLRTGAGAPAAAAISAGSVRSQ